MIETASAEMAGRNCPYCRFPIKQGGRVQECQRCRAVHHEDCWTDNGGCAITSCSGGPSAMATAPVVAEPVLAGHPVPPPPKLVPPAQPAFAGPNPAFDKFRARLEEQLRVPAVRGAAAAAAYAALVVVGVGLLLSLVFADGSLVGLVGLHTGALTKVFRQAAQELQVPFVGGRSGPVLLALVPVLACAGFTAKQQRGLEPTGMRLAWGAAVGVPFAALMVLVAVLGGTSNAAGTYFGDPSVGSAFLLGLLWGAAGGLAGAWVELRRTGWRLAGWPGGARTERAVALATATLRPFAVALLLATVVGTACWTVEVIRDKANARLVVDPGAAGKASLASSLGQTLLYAGDHGVHTLELGTGTKFAGSEMPLPVEVSASGTFWGQEGKAGEPRIFDYHKVMAPYVFIPLLIVVIAIPAVLALYAGFAVARLERRDSAARAAAWGAAVGPMWALTAVALNALVQKQFPASAVGDSVFLTFLLGGAALGALGGLLAHERSPLPQLHTPTGGMT